MKDRQTRPYEMLLRVQTFGKDNDADFAPGSKAKQYFTNLDGIITALNTAKAGQQHKIATAKEAVLDTLRLDLQNIARTARAIAQDEPGFADTYHLPASPGQTALLSTADHVITELGKPGVAARFIAHEMPANFVAALTADRTAVDTAQDTQETKRESSIGNTANIGPLLAVGLKWVHYLDAIMHNKYTGQPDKMAAWTSASHVERDPHHAATPAPTPQPV